jgi:patatin-like phospholipase/acyl hydrolase
MSELFQMVSGTSTGSLLTTAIVLPAANDTTKNKFWASDASNIYKLNGS